MDHLSFSFSRSLKSQSSRTTLDRPTLDHLAFGKKIKEGVLSKKSPALLKIYQKRTFCLYEKAILYSDTKAWNPKVDQCILLKNIQCVEHIGHAVKLVTAERTYELKAASAEEAAA